MIGEKDFRKLNLRDMDEFYNYCIDLFLDKKSDSARALIRDMTRAQKIEYYVFIKDNKEDFPENAYDFIIGELIQ